MSDSYKPQDAYDFGRRCGFYNINGEDFLDSDEMDNFARGFQQGVEDALFHHKLG